MSKDIKMIVQFNLADFLAEVVKASKEGYELSEENDLYPVSLGVGLYRAGLVKEINTISEVKEESKVGRPKKVSQ